MRDSMVLYRSFAEAMDDLPAEQYKEAMQAITKYAMDGIEPECSGVVKIIFLMAKPQIDANNSKHDNGKRGGRPKKPKVNTSETKVKTDVKTKVNENENHRLSDEKPNENVNVNVNVNEKEKINKKESDEAEFEQLWELYPKKQGKADARKHYLKAKKDGATFDEVKEGIEAYTDYIQKTGTDFQYVKMGSSFFCQRGWESTWEAPEGRASPEEGEVWHSSLTEEEFNRICEMHEGPDPW